MKNIIKTLAIFSLIFCALLFTNPAMAETPAPPPPDDHGQTGNQPPVGAPIDGGLGILLAMGAVYGEIKLYNARKEKLDDD